MSQVFICIEQILLKKAVLLLIATRSAIFDDFKMMWLIYKVTFASVFLSLLTKRFMHLFGQHLPYREQNKPVCSF